MIQLDAVAEARLEDYVRQVRASLQGCPSVDPHEVERDVREHVERELNGAAQPVPSGILASVLDRLGSPSQWIPPEERPWWVTIWLRLRSGPEDWRLAYLSFALLLAGVVFPHVSILLIIASFIVARSALTLASDPREIQQKRWLLYPSISIVSSVVALALVFLPPIGCIGLADACKDSSTIQAFPWTVHDKFAYWPIAISFIASAAGLWWLILGLVLKAWPELFMFVFRPLAERGRQNAVRSLIGIGVPLFLMGLTIGLVMLHWRGWYPSVVHFIRLRASPR